MQKGLFSEIKKIKRWAKENKAIDIILFGSMIRGKLSPGDIDLCVIIRDEDEEKSLELIGSLGKILGTNKKFQINLLAASSFLGGNTLVKTLLMEGFSIINNKSFSSIFGFSNKSLFTYTLKHFTSSKRVQLHYLLKGRSGREGILKEINGRFIGQGSIIVNTEKEEILRDVFDKSNVKYKIERILIS